MPDVTNAVALQLREIATIWSYYRDGSIKQYVRDHLLLRTEATSNNVADLGSPKAIEAVPPNDRASARSCRHSRTHLQQMSAE
jgi:hypothetical protein